MGGHQSRTRKLTVENDDPTSVIKVSDDVVQRIKNSQDARAPSPEPLPQSPPQQQPPVNQPLFIYEPNVTSLQLRQASLAELKKNDSYWENRLKNQQADHKMINDILDCEYDRAMKELDVKETTKKPKNVLPPCQDAKNAVLECYKKHANEPMQCANLVQAFQQCVDAKRATLVASRG